MTSPVSPPAMPTSRAGRNLPAAIAVGLGLGGVVIASLFLVKVTFLAVVAVVIVLAVWELANALATAHVRVPRVPLLVGTLGMLAGAYYGGLQVLTVALALTCLGCLVWRLAEPSEGYVRDVGSAVFTAVYVPFLAGFVVVLLREADGAWRVLAFIVVTVASDIGGYAVGVFLGRHPMAATISPKKSWEGFAGSTVACVVAGYLVVVYGLDGPGWVGALLGVAAAVLATLGDLCESMIKRDLGIKDMGTLLPGHGGLMDRLDSLLAVVSVAWLILHAFVPVG